MEVVELLLSRGANVLVTDQYGYIPLDYSRIKRYQDIEGYLKQHIMTYPPDKKMVREGSKSSCIMIMMNDGIIIIIHIHHHNHHNHRGSK